MKVAAKVFTAYIFHAKGGKILKVERKTFSLVT